MKNETLKQIISQIKKYELADSFSSAEKFKKWVSKLNNTQINNFLSLDINLEEVKNFKNILVDTNLLNCKDYKEKVAAISTLKNGQGCWHLFDAICTPSFLKSKNFYKDIEMLSKADTARYGLWILGLDDFINSPYHDEDLKLLVESHDTKEENPLDFVVSDALATVASNVDSINSPYHQADMQLISKVSSDCLQSSHTYPEHSLNNLAVDKVSLADNYHLENMQILATNPIASEFLYEIMTNPNFVKGENYRKEVEALKNAKSKATARALYYYIVNPERKYTSDMEFFDDCEYDENFIYISDGYSVAGSNDPDYLANLTKINKISDKFVMYFVSILMNQNFINCQYKKFDIHLLESISDIDIFMSLYRLMINKVSLSSTHHIKDAVLLSQTNDKIIREKLLRKAINETSLNSENHDYDMVYISKLNWDLIDKKIYDEINYYLFKKGGIEDPKHKEKLEKLSQGILVERKTSVSSYLDDLEAQIEDGTLDFDVVSPFSQGVIKPKIGLLSLFKKKPKK